MCVLFLLFCIQTELDHFADAKAESVHGFANFWLLSECPGICRFQRKDIRLNTLTTYIFKSKVTELAN